MVLQSKRDSGKGNLLSPPLLTRKFRRPGALQTPSGVLWWRMMPVKRTVTAGLLALGLLAASPVCGQDQPRIADGVYPATAKNTGLTYDVSAKVEDGRVTALLWPHGGETPILEGEITDGTVVGFGVEGDRFDITILEAAGRRDGAE
jgi:hypothetical protein